MYPCDETGNQAKIQHTVYIVRINGDTVLDQIRNRLKEEKFLTQEVQQNTLLQEGSPQMLNALCMVYPYKINATEIDDLRLNALAQRFNNTKIFVIGEQEAIKRHTLANIIRIPVEQLRSQEGEKTLDSIVNQMKDMQTKSIRHSIVAIYDPDRNFSDFGNMLRDNKFWVETSHNRGEFISDIEFNSDVLDAIILDYKSPQDADMLIAHARLINKRIPIIALARMNNAGVCPADYTAVKDQRTPWAQLQRYLKMAVEKRSEIKSAAKTETAYISRQQLGKKNCAFLFVGPSASGKTTALRNTAELVGHECAQIVKKSTTRPLRPGEKDGLEFKSVLPEKFEFLKSQSRFSYDYEIRGFKYGILKAVVEDAWEDHKHLLMVTRDISHIEPMQQSLPSYNIVPIMLFADIKTLEERLRARKSGDSAERIAKIEEEDKQFQSAHQKFTYTIYTDRGVTEVDTARRIKQIINWEEHQPKGQSFEQNHGEYVNTILKRMLKMSAEDLEKARNSHKWADGVPLPQADPAEFKDYAHAMAADGLEQYLKRLLPLNVVAVTCAYGHMGVFFDGTGNGMQRYNMFARATLMDFIEYKLKRAGIFPKSRARNQGLSDFSYFAFAVDSASRQTGKETILDGLLYALTDDYILSWKTAPPHAVSFGFVDPKANLKPAELEQLAHRFIYDSRRGNNPYDHEIKRALAKTWLTEHKPPMADA